jgi:ATP-dependent Clp protease ATP-binding subunit ClpA
MFERYTEDARRVLFFARYEATKLGGLSIAPEHVLLGLVREGHRRLREMLSAASVTLEDARRMVEAHAAAGASVPLEKEIPFQPATSRILQFAASEADALGHPYIGSEHLLLGMLRGEDAVAAAYLTRAGVQLSKARDAAASGRESDPLAMALPAPTYSGRRLVLTRCRARSPRRRRSRRGSALNTAPKACWTSARTSKRGSRTSTASRTFMSSGSSTASTTPS